MALFSSHAADGAQQKHTLLHLGFDFELKEEKNQKKIHAKALSASSGGDGGEIQ